MDKGLKHPPEKGEKNLLTHAKVNCITAIPKAMICPQIGGRKEGL